MKYPFHHDATGKIFHNARELRQRQTKAEKVLWDHLRNRRFLNLKFRRQHPMGSYILDFYCHSLSMAIEVDGSVHENRDIREYDDFRSQCLRDQGVFVLRFSNDQVLGDVGAVLEEIQQRTLSLKLALSDTKS